MPHSEQNPKSSVITREMGEKEPPQGQPVIQPHPHALGASFWGTSRAFSGVSTFRLCFTPTSQQREKRGCSTAQADSYPSSALQPSASPLYGRKGRYWPGYWLLSNWGWTNLAGTATQTGALSDQRSARILVSIKGNPQNFPSLNFSTLDRMGAAAQKEWVRKNPKETSPQQLCQQQQQHQCCLLVIWGTGNYISKSWTSVSRYSIT